jgi:hypothetical protein
VRRVHWRLRGRATNTVSLKLTSILISSEEGALEAAREENAALKEKINGLKQQYGPIGRQVLGLYSIYNIFI